VALRGRAEGLSEGEPLGHTSGKADTVIDMAILELAIYHDDTAFLISFAPTYCTSLGLSEYWSVGHAAVAACPATMLPNIDRLIGHYVAPSRQAMHRAVCHCGSL